MPQVRVPRRVQHLSQGVLVRERLRGGGEDGAHGLGHDALGVGVVADQAAVVRSQRFVEGVAGRGGFRFRLGQRAAPLIERLRLERLSGVEQPQIEREARRAEEVGIDGEYLGEHAIDDGADFGGDVRLAGEDVVAEQGQPVDRVVEVRRGGQRQDVAGDLLGPLLHRVGEAALGLRSLGLGPPRENAPVSPRHIGREEVGQVAVPLQGALDRAAVDLQLGGGRSGVTIVSPVTSR